MSNAATQLRDETDEDLLVWMSCTGSDPDIARAACAEFYSRHLDYIFGVCWNAHGDDFGREGVRDLVQEVFIRAMERAGTFKPMVPSTPDMARRHVRSWLGAVAHNLAIDWLRDGNHLPAIEARKEPTQTFNQPEDASDVALPPELQRVQQSWVTLTEREAEVLRVTMQYYDPARKHQRLPNGVAKEVAERFGIEPESLTQIRKRALAKIKMFVQQPEVMTSLRRVKA